MVANSSDLEKTIRKHALKNAFDFGKATSNAVIGKVIAEFPESKKDMKNTMMAITEIINKVNRLSKSEIENELKNYEFEEKKKDEKEKREFNIPDAVTGKLITRFPPEPSGYLHIGHAKAAFLNYEITQQYKGQFILRFDDTNPEKESNEYVEAIKDALKWLGISWNKESYTSDSMLPIYKYAEQLIKKGFAYVCNCKQEQISNLRTAMKPCPCRNFSIEANFIKWGSMLGGKYKEGDAILRFKGELSSLNTVMRDPTLARIILSKHYRQGNTYRVWPSYDFAVVVMDALEAVTHPMRTKEYELRDELYFAICDVLDFKKPTLMEFSRLEIKNAPISKRLILPLVKEKKVDGWDDPRLPTIAALRRRGILPEAVKHFVSQFGLSKVESEPGWELLLNENRKLLDPIAKHFFFVPEAVKLKLNMRGSFSFKLRGEERTAQLSGKILIPKTDYANIKQGEIFALKDLAFVTFDGKNLVRVEQKEIPEKKVQWATPDEAVKCEVLIPKDLINEDGSYNENSLEIATGFCEKACMQLNENAIIQFERFGFCRLDKKGKKKLTFIYSC